MRRLLEAVYHFGVKLVFIVLGMFVDDKLIITESFHGRQYSDNPRALYEYIRNQYPEYRVVWAVKRGYEQPFVENNVPYVTRLGFRWMMLMPRAHYWIFNTRMPAWMHKGKHNVYLETWHGTPLKKLGLDIADVHMPGTDTKKYRESFINETARWDYLLAPNTFSADKFSSAFAIESPRILTWGYPRNDFLLKNKNNQELIRTIKRSLNVKENQRVLLYAPTWRDDDFIKKGSYRFDNQFPFTELLNRHPDMLIVTRLHYLVSDDFDASRYGGRVIDASHYPDIRDLYLIADELVTDYSSVMFDYGVLKRPVYLYMYDYDKYKDKLRGFYFDPISMFSNAICYTKDELVAKIANPSADDFVLPETMLQTKGNASERITSFFFENELGKGEHVE